MIKYIYDQLEIIAGTNANNPTFDYGSVFEVNEDQKMQPPLIYYTDDWILTKKEDTFELTFYVLFLESENDTLSNSDKKKNRNIAHDRMTRLAFQIFNELKALQDLELLQYINSIPMTNEFNDAMTGCRTQFLLVYPTNCEIGVL